MKLAETKDVTITTVGDNYTDVLLKSMPGVERRGPEKEPLLAEHGLSMHIRLGVEAKEILVDAGHTKAALPHNLPRLEIDPTKVDQVVITHGHLDHTAGLAEFRQMAGKKMRVLVHPDAFLERTIAELKAIGPRLVMPAHCTGFGAMNRFATEMPDEFAPNAVGTRLTF